MQNHHRHSKYYTYAIKCMDKYIPMAKENTLVERWNSLGKPPEQQKLVAGWEAIKPTADLRTTVTAIATTLSTLDQRPSRTLDNLIHLGINSRPTEVRNSTLSVKLENTSHGAAIIEREVFQGRNCYLIRTPMVPREGLAEIQGCEDAATLITDSTGKVIGFALSDGVSGSLNGKIAAILAVESAADYLERDNSDGLIQMVQESMKDATNWDEYATKFRQEAAKKIDPNDKSIRTNATRIKLSINSDNLLIQPKQKLVREGIEKVAATTLLVGKIKDAKLTISKVGNMVCVVIGGNNQVTCMGNGKEREQLSVKNNNAPTEETWTYQLSQGDKIFAFSDGAFNDNPGIQLNDLIDYLKTHKDLPLDQILKAWQQKVGHDDCIILGIDY